jgi:glucose/arabinose dehydrogenase
VPYLEVDPAEPALLHCKVLGDLDETWSIALLLDGRALVAISTRMVFSPRGKKERVRRKKGVRRK